MNKSEILAFLNANTTCYMATLEGDKPRVRAMGMVSAGEDGIIIQTGTYKDIYKQLSANPNVELCFFNAKDGIQVRVSGAVEPVEDLKVKEAIVAQRTFLKPIVEKEGYDPIAVYRLSKGMAYVWSFATNLEPKTYVQL
ncbi:MAG TPA: pyridoxamine 5'-phosphate oxidase family protein [Dehalococcoidales bacterium]|nr:pyridoxamine 5'-phosphate oxidase family protein [Dehalococcoidales bacterium]